MADPTIQTFCCHDTSRNDTGLSLMQEFHTDAYNTVGLISSSIGILGAIYQILPRQGPSQSHRWFSSAARGRQIVVWLAVADLMASLGVFVRSALWIHHRRQIFSYDRPSVIFCALTSAWIQYFYTSTWLWTLCYAIDMRLFLKDRLGRPVVYHLTAWFLPAIFTLIGLCILYLPNANCHKMGTLTEALERILPNYCATYIPLAVVLAACPALYVLASRDVETVVACGMGQFTRKERSLVDTIRIKFAFINLVLFICWLPNIINGILLWALWYNLPTRVIITLWYIMAATNPLQAAFNTIVYRSWSGSEKVYIPCRRLHVSSLSSTSSLTPPATEATPLMQHQRINCSSTEY